jgi:hypothetical protein
MLEELELVTFWPEHCLHENVFRLVPHRDNVPALGA